MYLDAELFAVAASYWRLNPPAQLSVEDARARRAPAAGSACDGPICLPPQERIPFGARSGGGACKDATMRAMHSRPAIAHAADAVPGGA